jgi:hypothetical protein
MAGTIRWALKNNESTATDQQATDQQAKDQQANAQPSTSIDPTDASA